jgi:hypothetical protein
VSERVSLGRDVGPALVRWHTSQGRAALALKLALATTGAVATDISLQPELCSQPRRGFCGGGFTE